MRNLKPYSRAAVVVTCVFLSACATYPARKSPPAYNAQGEASWYGPGFQGRKTANGERYDQHALTAAHRTLPFGTSVKVTNLENGQSVVVRINDRGPYRGGRLIDLSRAAAEKIDLIPHGTAQVDITSVGIDFHPSFY